MLHESCNTFLNHIQYKLAHKLYFSPMADIILVSLFLSSGLREPIPVGAGFPSPSRLVPRPTQPLVQGLLSLSWGLNDQCVVLTTHLLLC